ncbi:hypothetical protein SDC9_15973 [bioreactor metagenome]|uniref:HNH domain-containing protein n=1 Tax=bioreactor metagenome TaxID=1076179 RepID=A0A644TT93_9ZZZZ
MKNLKPYNGDALKEYKDAINRKKKDSIERNKLEKIEPDIVSAYSKYKSNFDANTLHNINFDNRFSDVKNELFSLYDYQCKIIKNIRENIANQQIETIRNTCQNCTIDSVGSMDHILPKNIYPEYIVNPYNLFPCCSKCNQYKSITNGDTKFLNLFLDKLPEIQYLFVNVYADNDCLNFTFDLRNDNNQISSYLFTKIENHFNNLHLLERMKDCSISHLSAFISSIKPHFRRNGKEYVIDTTIESIYNNRSSYGYNYWKCSLEYGLITSDVFWDFLEDI